LSQFQPHYASQKGLKTNVWTPYEHQNTFGVRKTSPKAGTAFPTGATPRTPTPTPNQSQSQNQGQEKKAENVTIINNNVSNYINNIIHNHVTLEKKQSDEILYRPNKSDEVNESIPLHASQKAETIKV
jgi:hypothetical protein